MHLDTIRRGTITLTLTCAVLTVPACRPSAPVGPVPARAAARVDLTPRVVPAPASLNVGSGSFTVTEATTIAVDAGNTELSRLAEVLGALLRPSTGFVIPVTTTGPPPQRGSIILRLAAPPDRGSLGAEGYELVATPDSVRIVASQPAGIFYGLQTLRQLLPPQIESHMALSPNVWAIPAVTIVDQPRFGWRGAMLDVSRHFFTVREVKQFVDLLALYKLNTLHLHLADDQGWRIEIRSRPKLASVGGQTQVGGGPGGFYTQDEYTDIVRYARDRFITIVPEIDMPAHSNAALAGYPELSCGQRPPALYTGTEVGFSALCPDKEETYALVEDVVREIAAITPGAYFHVGGDEVKALTPEQYARFIERVQEIVGRHGKRMIGWEEIVKTRLSPTTLVQQWLPDTLSLPPGLKLVMSPSKKTYLDMKYTESTELGLKWAALIEVRDAYDWDPATYNPSVPETAIVGVEAPIWSETLRNITAVQYLAVPRLPAVAEVGWTPQASRNWENFRGRMAAHAPRWNFLGVNYYRSPQIPW